MRKLKSKSDQKLPGMKIFYELIEAVRNLQDLAETVDAELAIEERSYEKVNQAFEKVWKDNERLRAERDALREDAERYRWLRRTLHSAVGGGVEVNDMKLMYEDPKPNEEVRVYWYPDTPVGFYEQKGSTLDAAIDAARKGEA